MAIKNILSRIIGIPFKFLNGFARRAPWLFSDKLYIKIRYRYELGCFPNLKDPRTYTEKLQWLKLYNRNPLYTDLVDKVKVKKYVAKKIGNEFIIPTLATWKNADSIDFNVLPDKFVLKCNHTGGGAVVICRDKSKLEKTKTRLYLNKQLKLDMFQQTREWPYKNVKRLILCEPYLQDENGQLTDYKFYCFNGIVKLLLVGNDRFTSHNFTYFDVKFNKISLASTFGRPSTKEIKKPLNFERMVEIAKILSEGFPHVRVDLYNVNGHIYFGELTFYDASGYDDMNSEMWNLKLGSWINLPCV